MHFARKMENTNETHRIRMQIIIGRVRNRSSYYFLDFLILVSALTSGILT